MPVLVQQAEGELVEVAAVGPRSDLLLLEEAVATSQAIIPAELPAELRDAKRRREEASPPTESTAAPSPPTTEKVDPREQAKLVMGDALWGGRGQLDWYGGSGSSTSQGAGAGAGAAAGVPAPGCSEPSSISEPGMPSIDTIR